MYMYTGNCMSCENEKCRVILVEQEIVGHFISYFCILESLHDHSKVHVYDTVSDRAVCIMYAPWLP